MVTQPDSSPQPAVDSKDNPQQAPKAQADQSAISPHSQKQLASVIDSLPLNPARDLYGIEDTQLQTICFISQRTMEEGVRNENYAIAANAIGAWLISAGQYLGVLGRDRNLPAIFAEDVVKSVPALIPLSRMISDSIRPWINHSPEAQAFCRALVSKPNTHPLAALSFLNSVPATLALPWLSLFYNQRFAQLSDSINVALAYACKYHLELLHLQNQGLIAARRVYLHGLAKKLVRLYPDGDSKQAQRPEQKQRILFLVDRLRPKNDPQMMKIMALIDGVNQLQKDASFEFSIYETGDGKPSLNQIGYYPQADDRIAAGASAGDMVSYRKQLISARQWQHEEKYDRNLQLFFSAVYNFNPKLVVAVDLEDSVSKICLSHKMPVIDWLLRPEQIGLSMGAHLIAIDCAEAAARQMLQLSNLGRMDNAELLLLPAAQEKNGIELYAYFHQLFHAL